MSVIAGTLISSVRVVARAARFVLREPASALLAFRMAAWVVLLSILVRFIPLPRALKFIAPRSRATLAPHAVVAEQARLARILDSVLAYDFWMFTPTCWKRAAVLHRFLALKGINTRIIFGVRREGENALNGHAWLEAGGEPLLEKTFPDYIVTYSFPF